MTAPRPKGTKRADLRALVDAGKRYHIASLAYLYEKYPLIEDASRQTKYESAMLAAAHATAVYAVGRKRASVEYGHKHMAKSKKEAK